VATPSRSPVSRKKIRRRQILINGTWRDARDRATMTTIDPTTEEVVVEVAKASPADADEAVNAAVQAFEEGAWSRMHLEERAKLLFRVADLMDERAEDFAIREAMDISASPHEVGVNLRPNKLRIHSESTSLCRHKNVILIVTNCGKNPA
jgi:aldehyde dehydrogenase family protein